MNPDLEFFLENAFQSVKPTSDKIGRVVVEPDYDVDFSPADAEPLKQELVAFLSKQTPDPAALGSHEGFEAPAPDPASLLGKYIRAITLHADDVDGPWIEVAPPGNWI